MTPISGIQDLSVVFEFAISDPLPSIDTNTADCLIYAAPVPDNNDTPPLPPSLASANTPVVPSPTSARNLLNQPTNHRESSDSGTNSLTMSEELLGTWISDCQPPFEAKMYESGQFMFQVRPVDASGNVGVESEPIMFVVDASLSKPVVIGEEEPQNVPSWLIAAIGGGGAVAIVVVVAIIIYARRRAHRRRQQE